VLNLLAIFGANKLLGKAVELYGEEVDKLTLDERITISSMGTEMGAIAILFTPTEEIYRQLERLTGKKMPRIFADDDAVYAETYEIDMSTFVPMVARPGHPHDDAPVETVKKTHIDSAFIGSCTNGRLSDLKIAAEMLQGKRVHEDVRLIVTPGTQQILREANKLGYIDIIVDAGGVVSNPTCGACLGGYMGILGDNEVAISTTNRNFVGRMGSRSSQVYLANAAVAAASAVTGLITAPTR
ncbi:MAG: 3-isopropylmalate dehydratase large subunit, partial [Sulfurimonas sp.]